MVAGETHVPMPPSKRHERDPRVPATLRPSEEHESMMAQVPVEPGERLRGRYRVDGTIARGGTSLVLAGTDLEGHRPVAIKVLLPEAAKVNSSRSRFERELRVLRHLRNEHVVKVLDDGALRKGEPFMVLEQLRGRTLRDVLQAQGTCAVQDAVDFVLQASEVLAEAHAAGVVHRDVKPENLFLAEDEEGVQVKVIDFGLSGAQEAGPARDPREPSITRGNEVMGSPSYMPPEQLLSTHHVDRAADIWSLGVVLYELLTGRRPFVGDTAAQVRAHVMMSPVPSMRQVRGDIPAELESIVMRCLQKVPEDRYRGLAVLAASLAPFGSDRAKVSAAKILAAAPSKAPPPLPARPVDPRPWKGVRPPVPSLVDAHHASPWVAPQPRSGPRRLRSHLRETLVGVSVVFFSLGVAIGVVVSIW